MQISLIIYMKKKIVSRKLHFYDSDEMSPDI